MNFGPFTLRYSDTYLLRNVFFFFFLESDPQVDLLTSLFFTKVMITKFNPLINETSSFSLPVRIGELFCHTNSPEFNLVI